MKNDTEIISDMPEKHELVTQVSFKRPVLPARRTAAPQPIRYRQCSARQRRSRCGNSGTAVPRPRAAPRSPEPASGGRRPSPLAPGGTAHSVPARRSSCNPLPLCPCFWCTAGQGLCAPGTPLPACPVGSLDPGASPGWGRAAANLPGLTVAALPTLARHLSRPPVTSGHLRGGSVPAPEQPGRPFTPRRGAWRCPLHHSRPLGPRVPEGADRH